VSTTGDARAAEPQRVTVFHHGRWHRFRQYDREDLVPGDSIPPASLVVSDQSTLIIEPDWQGRVAEDASIVLQPRPRRAGRPAGEATAPARSEALRSAASESVQMEIVARRLQSIADAMGEVLRRTAVSVNVKERLDFSCAVFDAQGILIANAPHVPVHLGAMGHTVRHLAAAFPEMTEGDCYVSNDPYAGGSHLPDVTVVTPVFCDSAANQASDPERPRFFVASRAHHAEIGGRTPGSMPPFANSLAEEGVLIRDFALVRRGVSHEAAMAERLAAGRYPSRNVEENLADLRAQVAAGREGVAAMRQMVSEFGAAVVDAMVHRLLDVAADSVRHWIGTLPQRPLVFQDRLDDGTVIAVRLQREGGRLVVDFDGTSGVHPHGFNATESIVTSALLYVVKCFCDSNLPLCEGALRPIEVRLPVGLLSPPADPDPGKCAAVVAGNVETSQRLVDVLLGAIGSSGEDQVLFRSVAASQGTMNNVLMGSPSFGYYETIGGGAGATVFGRGADGVHTHMTNTRITDAEVLESRLPIRLRCFAIRRGSGGGGKHRGGDGLVREFEFLAPLTVSLLTSRRTTAPYGACGGEPGRPGRNWLIRAGDASAAEPEPLEACTTIEVQPGDRLRVETPGGGGWGRA
jgi:5-oxoprolinase (ATP-hydrolysing)